MRLDDARAAFQTWLHLPDTGALDVVLGAIAANRLPGDPVWLLLVGPPGGGKSEILNAVSNLYDSHPTGTLTEAALLSGTPAKEKAATAKGGLLRIIGDRGIIVCKDFGSVLSMHTDARSSALAALREVYDGAWTRHVGTDGGKTLAWQGHVGLVGGCTPSIDRHHAVMGAMGERFTLYRLPDIDGKIQARSSLKHAGKETTMRSDLAHAASTVLDQLDEPRELTDEESEFLVDLSHFVVRARSAVERDGYSREIELVSAAEAPGRLVNVLARLLQGLDSIGCDRLEALHIVRKAAADSIPALRFAVLNSLLNEGQINTNEVAAAVRHPSTTTRRALEDLDAHYLVDKTRQAEKQPHLWKLTDEAEATMQSLGFSGKPILSQTTVPEKPKTSFKSSLEGKTYTPSGFSGKQNGHAEIDARPDLDLDYYATLEPEPEPA